MKVPLVVVMLFLPVAAQAWAISDAPVATFTLHGKPQAQSQAPGADTGTTAATPPGAPTFGNTVQEPAGDDAPADDIAAQDDDNIIVPDYSNGDEALDRALDAYLSIFYHEFGHALIDIMQLPVLGLEEDAADTLSVVMIEDLWEAESSAEKLRAAAGFWDKSARAWEETGEAPDFGGVHSPDRRRYFTYVCLYYGADPDNRAELAQDLGLPEDRAETCPDEFALANKSWMPFLEELRDAGAGETLVWTQAEAEDSPFAAMLRDEVRYLNETLSLPENLSVTFTSCGMENAFYSPGDKSITMCTELADYMYMAEQVEE